MAATAPLLLGLWWCLRTRWPPVARLVRMVEERIAPLFAGSSAGGARARRRRSRGWARRRSSAGVVQTALLDRCSRPGPAVAVTAALFGLAHFLTRAYAVLAALVGAYLGWLHPRERQPAGAHRRPRRSTISWPSGSSSDVKPTPPSSVL